MVFKNNFLALVWGSAVILIFSFRISFAGIFSGDYLELYSSLENCQMYSQNDWLTADLLIPTTLPEIKSLDEIEMATGFFNWLDYSSQSETTYPSSIGVYVSPDNLKNIENIYLVTDNSCPKIYFDRPMDKTSAEQSAALFLIKDNQSREQNLLISGNWLYDGSYLSFTPTNPLLPASGYRIVISTGLKDSVGNHLQNNFQFDFNTPLAVNGYAIINSTDGISLNIRENSLATPGIIFLRRVSPGDNINEANQKVTTEDSSISSLGYWQISFYNTAGEQAETALNNPVRLTISYSDFNNDGFPEAADGKTTNIVADTLSIYCLDESKKEWQKVSTVLDLNNRSATAEISHFSTYALLGRGIATLDNVFAYPVPYIPEDRRGQFNASGISFTNLPFPVKITIVDTSGDIVKEIFLENPCGEYLWDVRDKDNRILPSGIYYYLVKRLDNAATKKGKLLIIR